MHSIVVAAEEQVSSDLGGEAVILDLKSGTYFGLDIIGARIWNLIQQPRSVADIRNTLMDEYEVASDRCEHDLLGLLQQLAANSLIRIKNGASS